MARLEFLEKPLPKPRKDMLGYASARTLEALLEALLALEYLEKGYTRNAAGKAFQAWRALTASILSLEFDKVLERVRDEEQRKWLVEKGLTRVPSTRLKVLARLVTELGYRDYSAYTSIALDLHDYQYHGPDPEAELSKYPDSFEAAADTLNLVEKLVEVMGEKVKPKLEEKKAWTREHETSLQMVKERLEKLKPGRGFA